MTVSSLAFTPKGVQTCPLSPRAGAIDAEMLAEVDRVMAEAIDVEGRLFDIKLTGAREDAFRNAMRLYGRLSALGADVGAFSADYRPPDQQGEVHDVLVERLIDIRQRFQVLQLLDLAVGVLDAGIVPLPDERGVARLLPALRRVFERRVPGPRVGAANAHAA